MAQWDVRCIRCNEEGSPARMAIRDGICYYCRLELDDIRAKIGKLHEEQLELETEFTRRSGEAAVVWERSPEGVGINRKIVDLMVRTRALHQEGVPWPVRSR